MADEDRAINTLASKESTSDDGSLPTFSKNIPITDQEFAELRNRGSEFAFHHGITKPEDVRAFSIGAVLSALPSTSRAEKDIRQDSIQTLTNAAATPQEVYEALGLSSLEIDRLEQERRGNCGLSGKDKWAHPFVLYMVVILCSVCAAVQGMDETVSKYILL
jgi:hypothetical protein